MTRLLTNCLASAGLKVALTAAAAALPATALADRFDRGHDRDRDHDRNRGQVRVDVDLRSRPIPECRPMYQERPVQIWVEPVYRTVIQRVWVEPVTQTVTERVWVPDRYEWRDVVRYENGWQRTERQQVLVEPAHYEDHPQQVLITPGHYEDIPHQELIVPGHWETRMERIAFAPRPEPQSQFRFDLRLPIR